MGKKVLIVDDDAEDRESMKTVLAEAGYEVVTAGDGAAALELLEADGISAVLLDIKMPTLSGYDLMRLVRERINHKVRIIYVSIVPQQEVNMDDIDGFVQKPFSPDILLKSVKDAIGE